MFDPFGTVGVGAATNLALGSDLQAALAGTTYGTLVRANNMVAYILPAGQFGPGLYGQVQMAAGEGAQGNKYWGGRIGYAAGPFDVAGSYGVTDCLDVRDALRKAVTKADAEFASLFIEDRQVEFAGDTDFAPHRVLLPTRSVPEVLQVETSARGVKPAVVLRVRLDRFHPPLVLVVVGHDARDVIAIDAADRANRRIERDRKSVV